MGRAGGADLRAALQQVVQAAVYLRLAWLVPLGHPQPQLLFCVFQPFRRRFALVQLRLSGLRVLWFDQAWPN